MSSLFQAGSEPFPGYRLIRPKGAPEGVDRWEATDPDMRRVVLRIVHLGRVLTETERVGLLALKQIRQVNVLPLLDVVEGGGMVGLVSPSFEMTLADRLDDCRTAGYAGLPRAELSRCLMEAAQGLEELHRPRPLPSIFQGAPPCHRDLRPENLVLEAGTVKLIDGGISTVLGNTATESPAAPSPWKAPEQLFLGSSTQRSDLYSLAASFLHLRLGRPPFPITATLEDRVAGSPNLDGLSITERPILERALEKDPARRWPSASAFASAWSAALNDGRGVATNGPASPTVVVAPAPVSEPEAGFPNFTESRESSVGAAVAVAVATAAPARTAKAAKPTLATKRIPVAQPASARPKVEVAPEDEEKAPEELLPPESVKGWAWSLVMHAVLLLTLALWVFTPNISKTKVIDSRLAGSELGSELGDQLKGGLGIDTPLALPEAPGPTLDEVPVITSLPESALNLEPPKISLRPTGATTASNGGGVNLTNPGQAGNGDGFGVAKFGHGGESINGTEVQVGDPQFTLIWNSRVDLDLHVLEPGGSEIYWENRNGGRGGELDVDDVDGFGPENVYWVQGKGPPGEYKWFVHYYGGNAGIPVGTSWKVRLKHNGVVTVFTGKLNRPGAKSQFYSFKMEPKDDKKEGASKDEAPAK